MSRRRYSSAASQTALTNSINNSVTGIVLDAVTGFPGSFPYELIIDHGTASEECVLVTAGTGTSLTVTRGFDGTAGLSHAAGATVIHGVSAIDYDEANAHVNETTTAHGLTFANLATKAGVEVLTNKDLSSGTNTFPGSLATDAEVTAAVTAGIAPLQGAWTSFTPTLTNMTLGDGTMVAAYRQVGKTVNFRIYVALGSTSVMGGTSPAWTVPVAEKAGIVQVGSCSVFDSSGTSHWYGSSRITGGLIQGISGGGLITGTAPFNWAVGDQIILGGTYEAA